MSSEAVPVDLLTIRAPAPDWFRWAISQPGQSQLVTIAGCRIHYLLWAREPARPGERGLLFVHGGGAHSHWWSYIAPYFTRDFRVAAIDLSGMGDSAWRAHYTSEVRAEEIRTVIAAAQLGERPFVVGHSFGGFMTMKVASQSGDTLGGVVIVDSPIRSPEEEARHPLTRPPMGNRRVYETFDAALARFRLMPEQPCDNPFIVEFIGRHSLRRVEDGWVWKFDSEAIGSRRFGEPVREYLQAVGCRAALIFGEKSALVSRETASYMSSLMGPRAPVVEVPEARHHVMLDQPLAFIAALRMLLDGWMRNEQAGEAALRVHSATTELSLAGGPRVRNLLPPAKSPVRTLEGGIRLLDARSRDSARNKNGQTGGANPRDTTKVLKTPEVASA